MNFFRILFYKIFALGKNLHELRFKQKALETQLDWLIKNSNRRIRRKWYRILTRPRSPFYIGNIIKKEKWN